jgi:hypothetical protein
MEQFARVLALVCFSLLCGTGCYALFVWLEAFAYEAWTPRYIEVPVFLEKQDKEAPPVTAATSSDNREAIPAVPPSGG